ncbi:MAG: hypothetical protein GY751_06685 [Bacteroidetes bacterium]|nr:hypothetical protein [Bacteroidota bacterium]
MTVSTWKNLVIGLLILLNLAALTTIWFGHRSQFAQREVQPRRGMPHERPEVRPRDPQNRPPLDFLMIEALSLDEQQAIFFRELKENHHKKSIEMREEVNRLKDELFNAISEESSEKAERLSAEIGSVEAEIELLLFYHFADIRALCTVAQQEQFDEMLTRIGQRIHPGPPPGRGPRH